MLSEIRAQLEAAAKPPLKAVYGAVELAAVLDTSTLPDRNKMPAAYVTPLGFAAGAPRTGTQLINQTLPYRIAVVCVVPAQSERLGEKAADEVETIYRAVRDALVGFTPPAAGNEHALGPMVSAAGKVVGFGGGVVFWSEEFRLDINNRKAAAA